MGEAVESFGQVFYYQQPISIFLTLLIDSVEHYTLF